MMYNFPSVGATEQERALAEFPCFICGKRLGFDTEIYGYMLADGDRKFGHVECADKRLPKMTFNEAMKYVLPYGKHKGETIEAALKDPDFLYRFVNDPKMSGRLKKAQEAYLEKLMRRNEGEKSSGSLPTEEAQDKAETGS